MEKTIEILKKDFPGNAVDLSESLQLTKEVINTVIEDISTKIAKNIVFRDFNNINKYKSLAEKVSEYEGRIDEIIDLLELNDELIVSDIEDSGYVIEQKDVPNYEDYQVDDKVEHSLFEDLTHKRPAGFKFIKNIPYEANSWKEVFSKTCEILYDINPDKFKSFERSPKMNGKRKKHFSSNPSDIRKPVMVGDVFAETNHNANTLRNIIVKLLKEYNFKTSDYKIYLRADYTELNKE